MSDPVPNPPVPAPDGTPVDPRVAFQAVRNRQIFFGLGFLAIGLELVVNQGAWIAPRDSMKLLAVFGLASVLNWSCPKCRSFLWVDTTGSTATRRRSRVRCGGCNTSYG